MEYRIIIDRMDAEEFLEMLEDAKQGLNCPKWTHPTRVIQNIIDDFKDLCGMEDEDEDDE